MLWVVGSLNGKVQDSAESFGSDAAAAWGLISGKRITSRMETESVSSMASRSMPMLAVGGVVKTQQVVYPAWRKWGSGTFFMSFFLRSISFFIASNSFCSRLSRASSDLLI